MAKDRPGTVRTHCGRFNKKDRTQEAAQITVDATVDPPVVNIAPPQRIDGNKAPFRPACLMERLSKVIEQQPGQLTRSQASSK